MNRSNKQAIVRPSFCQAPGPVSVSRRSAAGGCAHAQDTPRQDSKLAAYAGHVGIAARTSGCCCVVCANSTPAVLPYAYSSSRECGHSRRRGEAERAKARSRKGEADRATATAQVMLVLELHFFVFLRFFTMVDLTPVPWTTI